MRASVAKNVKNFSHLRFIYLNGRSSRRLGSTGFFLAGNSRARLSISVSTPIYLGDFHSGDFS
jgi:hypothetical protein